MLYANFEVAINKSELEEALKGSLNKLGYKVLSVKDRYSHKEYKDGKFVPVIEGVDYEVKKGFLRSKILVGFDFYWNFERKTGAFLISPDLVKSLYSAARSLNKKKYENELLNIVKTTMDAIPYCPETKIKIYE